MYSYMKGTITEISPSSITLEVSGIGYSLLVANPFGFKLNEEMKIFLVAKGKTTVYNENNQKAESQFIGRIRRIQELWTICR